MKQLPPSVCKCLRKLITIVWFQSLIKCYISQTLYAMSSRYISYMLILGGGLSLGRGGSAPPLFLPGGAEAPPAPLVLTPVVQRHKRYTKSKTYSMEDTVEFISAEIEFIIELQERLDEGKILTLNEVASGYSNMMASHGIKNNEITRKMLLVKINQSISNFTITDARGRKPAVIHSSETGRSSIDRALEERDLKEDMKAIFRCSKLIRQAILQSRKIDPWIFDGSLIGCSEKSVPPQLVNLIRWIIQGAKAGTTETRIKQLHKSCIILSQSISRQTNKLHICQHQLNPHSTVCLRVLMLLDCHFMCTTTSVVRKQYHY